MKWSPIVQVAQTVQRLRLQLTKAALQNLFGSENCVLQTLKSIFIDFQTFITVYKKTIQSEPLIGALLYQSFSVLKRLIFQLVNFNEVTKMASELM